MIASEGLPPVWTLSGYFASPEDPAIGAELAALGEAVAAFAAEHQGQVGRLAPGGLARLLVGLEALQTRLAPFEDYPFLRLTVDARDAAARALEAHFGQALPPLKEALAFVGRELEALGEEALEALGEAEALAPYRPYLRARALASRHALPAAVEAAIAWKDEQGSQAWRRLHRDASAALRAEVVVGLDREWLSLAEASKHLESSDAFLRESAARGIQEALASQGQAFAAAVGAVVGDRVRELAVRGHRHPLAPMLAEDAIAPEAVEGLLEEVAAHRHLVGRYARLKAQAMGVKGPLAWHDLHAPLGESDERVGWEEAKAQVLLAFGAFSPRMAALAEAFFTGQHVHARTAPWKAHRAFCIWTAGRHPEIVFNFGGVWDDLPMLAHELGHGVHYRTAQNAGDGPLRMRNTLAMEVPSTFAELLVFEALAERVGPAERLRLLGRRIENAIMNVFVQGALARFELALHAGLHGPAATPEALCQAWVAARDATMGDEALRFPEWTRWAWARHGSVVEQPLGSAMYPFGLLTTFALGRLHQSQGPAFEAAYFRWLEAGLSAPSHDLLAGMGLSAEGPALWREGLAYLSGLLDAYEAALS